MKSGKNDIFVFTSCSPELKKEQLTLWEILNELMAEWKDKKGVNLIINTHPETSIDLSAIKYDIFIGVVWTHFSSVNYPSGTATLTDFQHAYHRYTNPDDPAKIIFFIKDYPIPPSKIKGEGLAQLQQFFHLIKKRKNICYFYYDRDEFKRAVKLYLNRQISQLVNATNQRKEAPKPIRDVSHVLYRIASNTDSLEDYMIRITKLLGLYFNCSYSKIFVLDGEESKLRLMAFFDGTKSILSRNNKDLQSLSPDEEEIIGGNVFSNERIIGHPLVFNSLLGGLLVKRTTLQKPFHENHRQLLALISEQAAFSIMFYTKNKETKQIGQLKV